MRKSIYILAIAILILLLTGCKKEDQNTTESKDRITPTPQLTVTPQPSVTPSVENTEDTDDVTENDRRRVELKDYYPAQENSLYVYAGSGNEYAAYVMSFDFIDTDNNLMQTRTNNGGTETVRVIQIEEDKISIVTAVNECYYRDNLLKKEFESEKKEILLMEPLEKGTKWTLPDGRKRYISGIDLEIATPMGTYPALEVTTESEDSKVLDYYSPSIGLIKSIFVSGDMEVVSELNEIKTNSPYTQMIEIYYPDVDEKLYPDQLTVEYQTNEVTRIVLEEALKKHMEKSSYLPLISNNTMINSLYLGDDQIVYVDFSDEFVTEMNAGSGYEQLILQGITNTLGNYYGVNKVYITLEGKPYESGHVLMKKGETFEVDMDQVVR